MALVVITPVTGTTKVSVEFNLAAQRYEKLEIDKTHVRTVAKLADDAGVELIMTDDIEQLHYTYVDEVNGNSSITSNEILYNELCTLFNGN